MAQKSFHRFIALVLAIMVLISTSGLSIDAHFCSGKVKRISIYGKAKTCKEVAATKKSCCSKKLSQQENACSVGSHEKGCCSNQLINLQADLDFVLLSNIDFPSPEIMAISLKVKSVLFPGKELFIQVSDYLNFKPPLPLKQSLSIFQVYRL